MVKRLPDPGEVRDQDVRERRLNLRKLVLVYVNFVLGFEPQPIRSICEYFYDDVHKNLRIERIPNKMSIERIALSLSNLRDDEEFTSDFATLQLYTFSNL